MFIPYIILLSKIIQIYSHVCINNKNEMWSVKFEKYTHVYTNLSSQIVTLIKNLI